MTKEDVMTEQGQPSSHHLAAARGLLDELQSTTQGGPADAQTKATTAAAHAVLVLAEQVAAIRILLVGGAASRRTDAEPAERR